MRVRRRPPHPVFVGGTGRSGTSVVGRLIGEHHRYVVLPFELQFPVDNHGLADLLEGRASIEGFERHMRGKWYRRPDHKGGAQGLHQFVDGDAFERAMTRFKRRFDRRPTKAARALIDALVEPFMAGRAHKESWVDTTPYTIRGAATLSRLYPRAVFVHVIRDGRDVASSVTHRLWGPDEFREALAWWEDRRAQADAGARRLGSHRLLELRSEDLLVDRREHAYLHLLTFLEMADEAGMRRFFEEEMPARRAHLGRWRRDVPEDEWAAVTAQYEAMLDRLEDRRARPVT